MFINIHPFIHAYIAFYRIVKSDEVFSSQDASKEFRLIIETQYQQMQSQKSFSDLMVAFSMSAVHLLNSDIRDTYLLNSDTRDAYATRYKLAGILILDGLVDVNDENSSNRRIEISNSLHKSYENEKLSIETYESVFRSIALSMGHISRVASTTDIEFLHIHYFDFASKLLAATTENQRFCGALLLAQLAQNCPAMIFTKRKILFTKIWPCVCDKSFHVRCAATETLEVLVKLIAPRDDISEYCKQALSTVRECLVPHVAHEKLIGALLFYNVIGDGDTIGKEKLREATVSVGLQAHDIIWKFLQKKDSRDSELKSRVMDVMPRLAGVYPQAFVQPNAVTNQSSFLQYFVKHLIDIIRQKRERQLAYTTLGRLFNTCFALGNSSFTLVEEIKGAVQDGFKDPFCKEALECFAHMVNLSPFCRRFVTPELVDAMFRGGLTEELIVTLNAIMRNVPNIRGYVQKQLSTYITMVLQRHMISLDIRTMSTAHASIARSTKPSVPPRQSTSFNKPSLISAPHKSGMWSLPFFNSNPASTMTQEKSTDEQLTFALKVIATHDFFSKSKLNESKEVAAAVNLKAIPTMGLKLPSFQLPKDPQEDPLNSLILIIRDSVVRYLDDNNPLIRSAAAMSCLAVIDTIIMKLQPGTMDHNSVAMILDRLLQLGIGDNSAEIRFSIFNSIPASLDHMVVRSQYIYCLVEGLNDESIQVRAATMTVLSRVAHYDPLHLMPILRLTIERLIKQLQHSKDPQLRQESVQLLYAIVKGANVLIEPHVNQILNPLMALLAEPNTQVFGSAISTIGELSVASTEVVQKNFSRILPRLIHALNDSTSASNREVAVVALGKVMSSVSRQLKEPYTKFTDLFQGLVRAIQTESDENSALQMQAMRTAGLLGAVDPSVYQQYKGVVNTLKADSKTIKPDHFDDSSTVDPKEFSDKPLHEKRMTKIEKYYFTVIISELKDTLLDASLGGYHQTVLAIAFRVVKQVGYQAFPFIHEYMDGLMSRLGHIDTNASMKEFLLDHISSLVVTIGRQMRHYLTTLVKVINDHCASYLPQCLDILEATFNTFSLPEFSIVLRDVLSTLLKVIPDEISEDSKREDSQQKNDTSANRGRIVPTRKLLRLPKAQMLLQSIVNMKEKLGECRWQLIHLVVNAFDNTAVSVDFRRYCLGVLMNLTNVDDISEHANRIIHPIIRAMTGDPDNQLLAACLTAISSLLCRLGFDFLPFVQPIKRALPLFTLLPVTPAQALREGRIAQLEEYESLVLKLLRHHPLPPQPSDYDDLVINPNTKASVNLDIEGAIPINMSSMEGAWAISSTNVSPNDISDWLQRLCTELIRQAPNPTIRMCTPLVKANRASAEQLLNASFSCIWDSLYYGDSTDVIDDVPLIHAIETTLNYPHIPRDVVVCLLNVAEFMDMQDKRLPIDVTLLAKQAEEANMYARCLRYREIEFNSPNTMPSSECVEALITVNNELGLEDKATGLLIYVMTYCTEISVKPLWLEKLLYWNDARNSYLSQKNEFRRDYPGDSPVFNEDWMACELGEMRCLHALGDFDDLVNSASELKKQLEMNEESLSISESWLHDVNILGASAAWSLGKWDEMSSFVEGPISGDRGDVELSNKASFYQAVYNVHIEKYGEALSLIESTRKRLSYAISTLLSENYSRAYRGMVSMQILSELEEVIEFKQQVTQAAVAMHDLENSALMAANSNSAASKGLAVNARGDLSPRFVAKADGRFDLSEAKENLLSRWRARLQWAPKEIDVYRQILAVHSLVIDPIDDLDSWLELASLCRKENNLHLCRNILKQLGSPLLLAAAENPGNTFARTSLSNLKKLQPGATFINASISTKMMQGSRNTHSMDFRQRAARNRVLFATYKYFWASGDRENREYALKELTSFLDNMTVASTSFGGSTEVNRSYDVKAFRVRCLLKKAQWLKELGTYSYSEVIATVLEARELSSDQYSVWHAWAVTNYNQLQRVEPLDMEDLNTEEVVTVDISASQKVVPMSPMTPPPPPASEVKTPPRSSKPSFGSDGPLSAASKKNRQQSDFVRRNPPHGMTLANLLSVNSQESEALRYVSEAIRGFVKSIVLGAGQPIAFLLQDTLRLLTLWFSYGNKEVIFTLLKTELDKISPENWLRVIPQLIARMHVKSGKISELLRKLLLRLAESHPQALVCPISVAMNTDNQQQRKMAVDIVKEMRKNRSQLVDEASMLSRELMRVAMTPHELWHDGLEKAAQEYMEFKDLEAMKTTLLGLHEAMNESSSSNSSGTVAPASTVGSQTFRDISFRQAYGRQLADAHCWLQQYCRSNEIIDLHQAWEIYQIVFKRVKAQIANLKKVELLHVSPALVAANSLILAVPGTYVPFHETISIQSFSASVDVIASKQRPRKMSITGSNGEVYQFLLKGNEDLRQDERVMQLFGLINVCLENSRVTSKRGLNIVRYSVLPLSNNSGVIGWVENCDTINQLIKQYREFKGIRLNVETKLLAAKAPQYAKLPLISKMEAFSQVQEETAGQDLAKMLWLKSKTADAWVERRANFTKSMAVMSMVGYILGLGDRHPSNLMVDRVTGRVVHIDFGDCFEVTMKRAKFPEIIPFRLTRMLTEAMEKTGIEGTYRFTCERVMRVLRDNKDSLMAMLEAFVYDPLISWRLLHNPEETGKPQLDSSDWDADAAGAQQSANNVDKATEELGTAARSLLTRSKMTSDISGRSMRISTVNAPLVRRMSELLKSPASMGSITENQAGDDEEDSTMNARYYNLSVYISYTYIISCILTIFMHNYRALEVITRIQAKLSGRDFAKAFDDEELPVDKQVDLLIKQATSVENLCQLYVGWCPLW